MGEVLVVLLGLLAGASATVGAADGTWGSVANMSTARYYMGVAALDDKIYAVGGAIEAGVYLKSGEAYDLATDQWSGIANMSGIRDRMGLAALNGKLYAVGGNDHSVIKSGETYDPVTDKWSAIANMSVPRCNPGLTAMNGKLYAVGGHNSAASGSPEPFINLKSGEAYDPDSDSWSTIANMSVARDAPGLAALNGKIYAVGGVDGSGSVLKSGAVYDPATDSWSAIADMAQSCEEVSLAALNDKIFAVGGYNGHSSLKSGETYDPATDSWVATADMSVERSALGLAALDGKVDEDMGKLFAVGGSSGGSLPLASAEVFTPTAAYSCNSTEGIPRHGTCVLDPLGNQTAEECYAGCRCVVHNCGQLNGTVQCGALLTGCNVCDNCCQSYFHQHSCDGCFAAPVSEQGCGGQ
jgi:N-acetylneuraminic acid mutarotase